MVVADVPSTSKAGKTSRKRKGVEAATEVVISASKKAKVEDEATTSSRLLPSSSKKSPMKTSRGGEASPRMEIPRFSLDEVEETAAEKAAKSPAKAVRLPEAAE